MRNVGVFKRAVVTFCLVATAHLSHADTMEPPVLSGPPFSDPDHVESLSPAWRERPIERPADVDIAVSLDQHLYPALLPLIERYAAEHKIKVAVQEGTCGISSGTLIDKKADIAGFCCPAAQTDRLPGLRFHTVGIAALALIVHPDNSLRDVSLEQARGLFQGHLAYWNQVGAQIQGAGNDPLVAAVGRLHCKQRPGHWRLLLSGEDQFGPRMREVSTIPDMIADVSHNPTAIGYEVVWMTRNFESNGMVKPVTINGVRATDDAGLLAGKYPLYRTFNITSWRAANTNKPQADGLVKYLLDNAARIDPIYGIVPVSRLRQNGWRFRGDELIGEPQR